MARITREDLLLAGWHNVWDEKTGSRWVHPKFDVKVKFNAAAWTLHVRGRDRYGEML